MGLQFLDFAVTCDHWLSAIVKTSQRFDVLFDTRPLAPEPKESLTLARLLARFFNSIPEDSLEGNTLAR